MVPTAAASAQHNDNEAELDEEGGFLFSPDTAGQLDSTPSAGGATHTTHEHSTHGIALVGTPSPRTPARDASAVEKFLSSGDAAFTSSSSSSSSSSSTETLQPTQPTAMPTSAQPMPSAVHTPVARLHGRPCLKDSARLRSSMKKASLLS